MMQILVFSPLYPKFSIILISCAALLPELCRGGAGGSSSSGERRDPRAGRVYFPRERNSGETSGNADHRRGGEIALQLAQLYDYMLRRLHDANLRQADEPLAEVLSLLATLTEAWDGVIEALRPPPAPGKKRGPGLAPTVRLWPWPNTPGVSEFEPEAGPGNSAARLLLGCEALGDERCESDPALLGQHGAKLLLRQTGGATGGRIPTGAEPATVFAGHGKYLGEQIASNCWDAWRILSELFASPPVRFESACRTSSLSPKSFIAPPLDWFGPLDHLQLRIQGAGG